MQQTTNATTIQNITAMSTTDIRKKTVPSIGSINFLLHHSVRGVALA
jgi:hypothetical protein